ncbi:hypothetical protein U9M48_003915 [Paspalum notatum var. saurae]|uniref:Uncharacterized protein n=1 Tax=Paspalum notatum var. saurae TaxID=547442 RepID=A0AAQ3PMJ5_PASNO
MELAVSALGSLLPKLGTLLSDEYKLQKGVRGEIKFLQAEMESMQAALNKVSKLPAHQIEDGDKIWARNLKELCYDIEDSVDTFMVRIDAPAATTKPHSFRRFFDRTISLLTKAKNRHRIADDIEDIKRRIKEVAERRDRNKFEATVAQPDAVPIDPRVRACFEDAAKLVGTDGPAEKISNTLTKGKGAEKQKLMVVSIVGVGGLGKTTIANLVYERLGGQFDCKAFVSVSLKPNMKQILSSILRQVSKDKCTNSGEKDVDELIRNIREFLGDKRYFVVIDDVWDEEAWKTIKCAFPDKNVGSRVIVTTRKVDVAKFSSTCADVVELDPLSGEDSRRLFCKRVFDQDDGIYSELEEVTEKILRKCGGVPLAIITIASLLASLPNKTKYEWYGVYKSMGSGLHKDKSLVNMREILYLSYCDLPSYLKPCLLYLSTFPEDYEIQRHDLVRLWVAEGFVDEKQGGNLYALGERYLNELVNRNMIQLTKYNVYGPCHILPACNIRRLSLQDSKVDSKEEKIVTPATLSTSHVRSLVAFDDAVQWMPPLSRFSALRVFALKTDSSMNIHAKDLASLHHLRYLEIRGQLEKELLEGIGNLKLLKTLNLWGSNIVEVPTSILQLQQLENLLVDDEVQLPDGIGNLSSLQVLSTLNVQKSLNSPTELGNLTQLRVLRIYGLGENLSEVNTFFKSLSNLGNLTTLDLNGGPGNHSLDCTSAEWRGPSHLQIFDGCGLTISQVPRWFSSLLELTYLEIRVEQFGQEDLKLLGALPVLRSLDIVIYSAGTTEERLLVGADQPFRSLAEFKFLHRSRCWLVFSQGAMPKVQRLELRFTVPKQKGVCGLDTGLENLASLRHVDVTVDWEGACGVEVEDVETTIRDAIEMHPNHPSLDLKI